MRNSPVVRLHPPSSLQMTVATKIEAPVKFLFPSSVDPAKQYPFSVLGLGDIVVPATFCTLMRLVESVCCFLLAVSCISCHRFAFYLLAWPC